MSTIAESIQDFLRDRAVGQSKQTIETYTHGMRRLCEFLISANIPPTLPAAALSVDHALDCARWLSEERGISKSSLRTYLSSISQLYSYLLREKTVDLSASDMERMRDAFHQYRKGASRPLPKLPPDEAISALLSEAKSAKLRSKERRLELIRLRNIAMLEALRSSGMRVGELVSLRRDDLDYRGRTARVTGKGDKQRIVYFDGAAWEAIQTYLKARNDGARGRALYELALFSRHDLRAGGDIKPMTTHGVRLFFNALARAAGIEIVMTPHSLRHAFATRVLDATGDLAVVQDMLGHSSPATTRIYAKVSSRRMRDAHRAAFGNDDKES
jgi:integrase/recombinase XerC